MLETCDFSVVVKNQVDIFRIIIREDNRLRQPVDAWGKIKSSSVVGFDEVVQLLSDFTSIILDAVLGDDHVFLAERAGVHGLFLFIAAGNETAEYQQY